MPVGKLVNGFIFHLIYVIVFLSHIHLVISMEQQKFTRPELEQAFMFIFREENTPQPNIRTHATTDAWYLVAVALCTVSSMASLFGYLSREEPHPLELFSTITFACLAVYWVLEFIHGSKDLRTVQRQHFERKYLHLVEDTDAYNLLLEAVQQREKGIVEGLGDKKATEEYLCELWITAFTEVCLLETRPEVMIPKEKPIGEKIVTHLQDRKEAEEELRLRD